jgi:gas vesicle protein
LTTYSNLYNVAVRTDADATADYWAKDYAQMTQNTEDWNKAVNDYLKEVEEETETWRDISEQANRDVKGALDNSASATNRLTNESERLANMV